MQLIENEIKFFLPQQVFSVCSPVSMWNSLPKSLNEKCKVYVIISNLFNSTGFQAGL